MTLVADVINAEEAIEAISLIDEIITIILKGDKWRTIANQLSKTLIEGWDEQTEDAINEAIEYFSMAEGDIDQKKETKEILSLLNERLSENYVSKILPQLTKTHLKIYKTGLDEIDTEYKFNKTSKDVLKWAKGNHSYWLGNYYQRQHSNKTKLDLSGLFTNIIQDGMSRDQAGRYLKRELKGLFNEPENYHGSIQNYFEGISNHFTTQIREFAHIDGYERAAVDRVRIKAILDGRTSEICRELHGRIIPVDKLKKQRDKIIKAKTPENAKEYSLWLTGDAIQKQVKHVKTTNLPKWIGIPPYHFFCRTILEAVFDEDMILSEKVFGEKLNPETKEKLDSYTLEEYNNWVTDILRRAKYKGLEYSEKDIDQDMWKHAQVLGIDKKEDYIASANDIVSKSDLFMTHVFKGEIQFLFFNGKGFVITDKDFVIRGYFPHKNREGTLNAYRGYKEERLCLRLKKNAKLDF